MICTIQLSIILIVMITGIMTPMIHQTPGSGLTAGKPSYIRTLTTQPNRSTQHDIDALLHLYHILLSMD